MNAVPAAPLVSTLRRVLRPPAVVARCDFCAAALPQHHAHIVDTERRRILCTCASCGAVERTGPYRRVGRRVVYHPSVAISSEQWLALAVPVELAFFFFNSALDRMVACYPGPAGATEAVLPSGAWAALVDANPSIAQMAPDVEALLARRIAGEYRGFVVPIDACYELVGRIRTQWSGLGGGDSVQADIDRFFAGLLTPREAGSTELS